VPAFFIEAKDEIEAAVGNLHIHNYEDDYHADDVPLSEIAELEMPVERVFLVSTDRKDGSYSVDGRVSVHESDLEPEFRVENKKLVEVS
jgi:hypothetical protein